jgi:hypothetical protein
MLSSELPRLNIDGVKQAIKEIVIKLDEPCFFEGTFGIGKSVGAKQAVEELNRPGALEELLGEDGIYCEPGVKWKGVMLCDIRLGGYDSVDMRGTPWPDKTTALTRWFAPSTMPFVGNDAFPDDWIVLVLFDEYNMASPEVFGVTYQLVNDRHAGEHAFKKGVRIALAGNLQTDKGVVNTTPMPLNNRGTHFEAVVDAEQFTTYLTSVGAPPIFVAFLLFCKDLVNTYDPKKPTPVVATSRTIEKAIKYYKSNMPEDLKRAAMEGVVGKGWTTQFMGFHDVWRNVIPIRKILADPEGVPLPTELSMVYATVVNIAGAMTLKNFAPLYKFVTRLDAMYVVLCITLACTRDNALYGAPEFIKDYTKRYRAVHER